MKQPNDTPVSYQAVSGPGTTRTKVRDLTRAGLKPRQISDALRISTQRVYQILQVLRDAGELPSQEASA